MRRIAIVETHGPTGIACAVELERRGVTAVWLRERGVVLDSLFHFPGGDALVLHARPARHRRRAVYVGGGSPDPSRDARLLPRSGGALRRARPSRDRGPARSSRAPPAAWSFRHRPDSVRARSRPRRRSWPPASFRTRGGWHSGRGSAARPLALHLGLPVSRADVVVIGGKNSAAEAALDLYRHGARVTIVVRGPAISDRVKYWIKPDLENRIAAGAIAALFLSTRPEIGPDFVRVATPDGEGRIPADAVFPLIGYEPDFALFERCGIRLEGEAGFPRTTRRRWSPTFPGCIWRARFSGAVRSARSSSRTAGTTRADRRRDRRPARGGGPLVGSAGGRNPLPLCRVSGNGGGQDVA